MRARDLVSNVGSATALVVAVFAVGGAFRWAQAIVLGLLLISVVAVLRSRRVVARRSPLLVTIGLAIALTCFQLIPLPAAILDVLQPTGSALRSDGSALANVHTWQALTLDVPGTLRALAFLVMLFAAAWLCLRDAASDQGRYKLLGLVALVCGAVAVTVGIHEVADAHALYGIYQPAQARPSVLGPLLNENHLGGLMAIGALVAAGLAAHRGQRSWVRAMWLLIVAACGIVVVASQSRGATFGLMTGAFVTAGALLGQRLFGDNRRRSRGGIATTSLPIAIVVVCTIVVIIYASAGSVSSQLERTSLSSAEAPTSKVAIWRSSLQLVEESPVFGVGRGAFEPVFTRVHPTAGSYSYSHLENELLQTVVDWGLIGAILLGLGGVWIAIRAFRRWHDGALIAGALGAMTAIALQSLVDFGIELPGVALPLVIVLSTLTYGSVKTRERARPLPRVALAAALGLAAIVLMLPATRSVAEDHAELLAHRNASMSELSTVIARHPLDYYGYARGAELLRRTGDARAVQFLNHALRLHPTHPGLHQLAADMLLRAGHPDQAALEYRAALEATHQRVPLIHEVLARLPPELVVIALPIETQRVDEILDELPDAIAIAWLKRLFAAGSAGRMACEKLYNLALTRKNLDAAGVASKSCGDYAPGHDARVTVAQMLLEKGRFDEARAMIGDVESWTGHVALKSEGWLIMCDSFERQKRFDDAKHCLRQLDASGVLPAAQQEQIVQRIERINQAMRAQ